MPCHWTFTMTNVDGQRVNHMVAESEKLYVGFFDIGLLSDGVSHHLHLRADTNKVEARQTGEALADKLRDVIRRCMAHVRLLDYDHTGADQPASDPPSVASQAYSLNVWAGPNSKRQAYTNKPKRESQQKLQQTVDNDWQYGDGWHSASSWYSASSW